MIGLKPAAALLMHLVAGARARMRAWRGRAVRALALERRALAGGVRCRAARARAQSGASARARAGRERARRRA